MDDLLARSSCSEGVRTTVTWAPRSERSGSPRGRCRMRGLRHGRAPKQPRGARRRVGRFAARRLPSDPNACSWKTATASPLLHAFPHPINLPKLEPGPVPATANHDTGPGGPAGVWPVLHSDTEPGRAVFISKRTPIHQLGAVGTGCPPGQQRLATSRRAFSKPSSCFDHRDGPALEVSSTHHRHTGKLVSGNVAGHAGRPKPIGHAIGSDGVLAAEHPTGVALSDASMRRVSLAVGRDPVERVRPPRSTQCVLPQLPVGASLRCAPQSSHNRVELMWGRMWVKLPHLSVASCSCS